MPSSVTHTLTRTLKRTAKRCAGYLVIGLIGLWAWAGLSSAAAQSVEAGAAFGPSVAEPSLLFGGLELAGLELDLRLAGAVAGPLELGVRVRDSFDFGPIGRVNLSARADLDTVGGFELEARGDGVLGPLGARANLSIFNVNPERFEPARGFSAERPRYDDNALGGEVGVGLALGGTYRLSRLNILDLDPQLTYLSGSGFGVNVRGSVQLRRLVGSDDGNVRLLADLGPDGAGFAATGFEYRVSRADIPSIDVLLWVGAGSRGVAPGLRLRVGERDRAAEAQASFAVALEPFRTDTWPYRLQAELGVGALDLALLGAIGGDTELALLALTGSYRWRF